MKTFEDVFSVLLHNYSSKKLKQLILLPFWEGMGEAAFLVYHLARPWRAPAFEMPLRCVYIALSIFG